jgi:hypothetical protein
MTPRLITLRCNESEESSMRCKATVWSGGEHVQCWTEADDWTGYCVEHRPTDPRILADLARSQEREAELKGEQ